MEATLIFKTFSTLGKEIVAEGKLMIETLVIIKVNSPNAFAR